MTKKISYRVSFVLLVLTGLVGCDYTSIQTVETVVSEDGMDRLIRKDLETVSTFRPFEKSYNSHSLVWQRLEESSWTDKIIITQSDFQGSNPNRRWIREIESFDPITSNAILKIAEGDAPQGSNSIKYVYSWREWNIKDNREIKTIRVCKDPFEPFMQKSTSQ